MADLDELLKRMEVFAARLGTMNPKSVQILTDAAWWMTMLATKVVQLSAKVTEQHALLESRKPRGEELGATRAAFECPRCFLEFDEWRNSQSRNDAGEVIHGYSAIKAEYGEP